MLPAIGARRHSRGGVDALPARLDDRGARAAVRRRPRARAGFRSAIFLRHVLRTALLPLVTVVLLDAALLVSGAVVTESVFAWPGLGTLFTEALARRDYSVLMAMVMLASAAVVVIEPGGRSRYPWLDPRVTA